MVKNSSKVIDNMRMGQLFQHGDKGEYMNYLILLFMVMFLGCETKDAIQETKEIQKEQIQPLTSEAEVVEADIVIKKIKKNQLHSELQFVKKETEISSNKAVLWRNYRDAKNKVKKAEASKKYDAQEKYLLQAAKYANLLDRSDIEAWQYNNAGYTLIKKFKAETNYYEKMKKLNSLIYKSEIDTYRAEMITEMLQYKRLLQRTKKYLILIRLLFGLVIRHHLPAFVFQQVGNGSH